MSFIVQRRDSENSSWHTCSLFGKKCKYGSVAEARASFRKLKHLPENVKVTTREFRIINSDKNNEEVE